MVDYYENRNKRGDRSSFYAVDKGNVVGTLTTRDFKQSSIPYFDTESRSGYNSDYLYHLVQHHPDNDVSTAAHALYNDDSFGRFPTTHYGYHSDSKLKQYKDVIDNKVDRNTLWVDRPERKHIEYAMSYPDYKPHMATLFGIALSTGPKRIEAAGSLSSQSSRLARHAKDVGFNIHGSPENKNMVKTNNIDSEYAYDELSEINADFVYKDSKKLTPSQVSRGKQFLKDTIREGKAKKTKESAPKQMTRDERHAQGVYPLPGFDDPE